MIYERNPRYWLERRAQRKTGFPLGTLAYYGPDESRASKIVVGILPTKQDREISVMRKWYAHDSDVRTDPLILNEVLKFLDEHRVERVVMVDQIMGCPHEEGIDYQDGETCPHCPYWAHRNRWTGEPIEE